jgi:hypothetical protein
MSNYSWTISSGGTITTNFGSIVVVKWHTAGSQWLKVNYTNSSGCTAALPTQYNVTVNPIPVPTLTGDIVSCAGATGVVYTTEAGMNSYSWSFSAGGINTSGGTSTSNTITMTWNTAGPQWVKVSYTSPAGCAATAPTNLDVTVNTPVAASVSIAASSNPVDAGIPVTFTASPVNGGTTPLYQWIINSSPVTGATNNIYTYTPANNDQVQCVMTSTLSCVSGSPANSNVITMTVNSLPVNLTVQNVTVLSGQSNCYNATDTILVAGGITTFQVESSGSATFIAGKAIFFLPGTSVALGGTLVGKIAPAGPWCSPVKIVEVQATGTEPEPSAGVREFVIFPNPTNGNFTLVSKNMETEESVSIEVYSMSGKRILTETMVGKKQEIMFSEMAAGLYFVKLITPGYTETIKLVKNR